MEHSAEPTRLERAILQILGNSGGREATKTDIFERVVLSGMAKSLWPTAPKSMDEYREHIDVALKSLRKNRLVNIVGEDRDVVRTTRRGSELINALLRS